MTGLTVMLATEMTLTTAVIVFVLAMFVGLEIITKVPTMLHTPLMSGSNAISGITIVGALAAAAILKNVGHPALAATAGTLAVAAAMINVVGGYLVTDRMLRMFKRSKR
ncbi:MAG: NAD(P) transhydrogenase subunit alpha [Planctomycetaceae bacterium]|nr:NAD(P) transhydrogenase subunit alpha [Planctomycetaceae bacterium]